MARRSNALATGIFFLALAGCAETHLGPSAGAPPDDPPPLHAGVPIAELDCSVNVVAGTMTCGPVARPDPASAGVAAANPGYLTVGGQHRFARLGSALATWNEPANEYTFLAFVQNLTLQPWATLDSETVEGEVRVFFVRGPTVTAGSGTVQVVPDGHDHFTSEEPQPYYAYGPDDIEGDGILRPGETSGKWWQFDVEPDVEEFEFGVLIHAAVPDLDGLTMRLVQIGTGHAHTCGLTSEGKVYCWAANNHGQLGTGDVKIRYMPTPAQSELRFREIAVGGNHTCALTEAGAAYCWGHNARGQLGIGSTTDAYVPTEVLGGRTYARITAGTRHTCAWTDDGEVYCWGENADGQLGDGSDTDRLEPVKVAGSGSGPEELPFTHVFGGEDFTCGLATVDGVDGKAYCWGSNGRGQLGNGGGGASDVPVEVSGGLAFATGDAGGSTACAITHAGGLYCWGDGADGKLGIGDAGGADADAPTPVTFFDGATVAGVAVGGRHACALANDTLYCWGSDNAGQLGVANGGGPSAASPVEVNLSFVASYGLDVTPTLVATGAASTGEHTCALSRAGPAYCWGESMTGQAGAAVTQAAVIPVWVAVTR